MSAKKRTPIKTKAGSKKKSTRAHHVKKIAKHENTRVIVGASALILLVTVSVISALYFRFQYISASSPNVDDHYSYKVWQPNEIIESKDIAFSFNGVRADTTSIPNFWELDSDKHYVIVDVSFKNKSPYVYQLSPISSMFVIDEQNNEYSVTSAPSITSGLGGQVQPGQTVKGEVGFTLPRDSKSLKLFFKPYVQSSAPIWVAFNLN